MPTVRARNKSITRNLTILENKLKRKLELFYNTYIKNSLTPVEILRQKHDTQLRNILNKAIEESYLYAIKTVEDAHKGLDISLTQSDFNNISRLVNEQSNNFWKLAAKLRFRDIQVQTEEEHQQRIASVLSPFNAIAAFIGHAAQTVFTSFNTAIKSKVSELTTAFDIGGNEPTIPIPITGRVKFMTKEDAKVCPTICQPLADQIFPADEAPVPIQDTHLQCRCRLVPLIEGE